MIRNFVLMLITAIHLQSQASMPGADYSPPGWEITYFQMKPIVDSKRQDENTTWYFTEDGSYLMQNLKNKDDYKLIKISKWEEWYCVTGFPGYCAKILGFNGKISQTLDKRTWPQSPK